MRATRGIPDDVIEAIVCDRPVEASYAPLAAFAREVRALGDGPVPGPSRQLAALLEGRTAAGSRAGGAGRPRRVAELGLVAKVGLGTSLVAASVVGAGAAGVLPAAATDTVRHAIEAVSPVDFHDDDATPPRSDDGSPAGPSDTTGGDDPPGQSGDTTGTDHRPDPPVADEPPGQSGDTGLTRANETPAAPHAPDSTPAATAPGNDPDHGPPDTSHPSEKSETSDLGSPPRSVPSTVPSGGA